MSGTATDTTRFRSYARDLTARMTLAEKAAQLTQAEKNSITPDEVAELGIGSVLSGSGGNPDPNTPTAWRAMVDEYLDAATRSRLGIPLLYGTDSVHGHGNVHGATIFPHNIGLGATGDPELVEAVYRATAIETAATG
ncbi:MAG: beta-glucosidase, partial [Acidimicrobiia bacterium]|nr:beta-glucosidase [Acidimicrobiia bacterium]